MAMVRRFGWLLFMLAIGWSAQCRAGWLAVPGTNQTRVFPGITTLSNGKVLVVGGYDYYKYLSSALLYDPASNSWSSAGNMWVELQGPAVTALPNGKALVTSGATGISSVGPAAELYDSATNSWSRTAYPSVPRLSPVILLASGKLLMTGGVSEERASSGGPAQYLASAELFDPATNTWNSAGSMARARTNHRTTLLLDGRVLVTGGYDDTPGPIYSNPVAMASAELYNPVTESWSSAGNMITARYGHTATLLSGGKVLVSGGGAANMDIYDPVTNSWSSIGSMATVRGGYSISPLPNGKALVSGGTDLDGHELSSAELYDPTTNSWSSAGSMAAVRTDPVATPLPNGKVLVYGGYCCFQRIGVDPFATTVTTYKNAELYDPATNSWSSAGNMNVARLSDIAKVLPSGKVFVTSIYGSSAELFIPTGPDAVEFYNSNLDHYFLTANAGEAAAIDKGSAGPGWTRTGNTIKTGGETPVCRFYGSLAPGPNTHFYTADATECNGLKQLQASTPATQKRWNFEALDFLTTAIATATGACPPGTTPVYRAYNNGFARGVDPNHRLSTSQTMIQQVVARGWVNEGVVMCAPI